MKIWRSTGGTRHYFVSTLHCALENVADLYVNERQKISCYICLLKKEEEEERMPNRDFILHAVHM